MIYRKTYLLFLICLLISTGFFREYVFSEINEIIRYPNLLSYPGNFSQFQEWLGKYSMNELIQIKWIITFVFVFTFLFITLFIFHYFYPENIYKKYVVIIYAGGILLASFAIMIGLLFPEVSKNTYYFARLIMGLEQSPLLTGILLLSFRAFSRINF